MVGRLDMLNDENKCRELSKEARYAMIRECEFKMCYLRNMTMLGTILTFRLGRDGY